MGKKNDARVEGEAKEEEKAKKGVREEDKKETARAEGGPVLGEAAKEEALAEEAPQRDEAQR